MKKRLALIVAFVLLASGIAYGAVYNGFPVVNVKVNGTLLKPDVPALVMNGRTLLPLRAIAESLGCYVGWDQGTMTASIEKPAVNMIMADNLIPEDDGTITGKNLGAGVYSIGKDNAALFLVDIGPLPEKPYLCRLVMMNSAGSTLATSSSEAFDGHADGNLVPLYLDKMNLSTAGVYYIYFQVEFDGKWVNLGTYPITAR